MQPAESCCAASSYVTSLKALFFIKIALKLSYFCKKMQNFQALGALPPDPQNSPPIANFWLRACLALRIILVEKDS